MRKTRLLVASLASDLIVYPSLNSLTQFITNPDDRARATKLYDTGQYGWKLADSSEQQDYLVRQGWKLLSSGKGHAVLYRPI